MKISDASAIVNALYQEITGNADISEIDATNIVEIGKTLQGVTSTDNLYGKICDKVGKVVILNKTFRAKFPQLYRDGWTYGSILETLRIKPFVASTDPSNAPTVGTYDSFTKYAPADVVAKYYEDEVSFQYQYWKPSDQLWTAFTSLESMTRFLSAIEIAVSNSLEADLLGLAQTALNNMAMQTVNAAYGSADLGSKSTSKAVNVLFEYNDQADAADKLTEATFAKSDKFWAFFAKKLKKDRERIQLMTKIYNIDGEDTHTNAEDVMLTVLSQYDAEMQFSNLNVYNKNIFDDAVGSYTTIASWQAVGEDEFSEAVASEVELKISTGNLKKSMEVPFVLGYLYDKMAVGIACEHQKTTSFYHPDLDQTKMYDKYRAMYYNDFSQNFIVYFVADATE